MKSANPNVSNIIYIGNARCFHTMDWYRNAQVLLSPKKVLFATDLINSEGHTKIVRDSDCIINLFNIDRLLLRRQSHFGNLWRNLVKTLMVPIQVWHTRRIARIHASHGNLIFHAHTMYYMWVCWLAGVKYVGTPQGSEILVRPQKSFLYRYFAIKSLLAARHVTVDSTSMRDEIGRLCGIEAHIIQNGIDVSAIQELKLSGLERDRIVSIRIIHPNYRIDRIFQGRADSDMNNPITFVYPQWDENYKNTCFSQFEKTDQDIGRLPRHNLYELLVKTLLVISIPKSDSSPRSVYEAIFCGCCVAVTYNPWVEAIPDCMKERLFIVDLDDQTWFSKAIAHAKNVTSKRYQPSEIALDKYDQLRSMKRVIELCYGS